MTDLWWHSYRIARQVSQKLATFLHFAMLGMSYTFYTWPCNINPTVSPALVTSYTFGVNNDGWLSKAAAVRPSCHHKLRSSLTHTTSL